jgi:hypothetical protein
MLKRPYVPGPAGENLVLDLARIGFGGLDYYFMLRTAYTACINSFEASFYPGTRREFVNPTYICPCWQHTFLYPGQTGHYSLGPVTYPKPSEESRTIALFRLRRSRTTLKHPIVAIGLPKSTSLKPDFASFTRYVTCGRFNGRVSAADVFVT